jgi:hypothetical protein
METVSNESVLAEFTMYFLCPGSEDEGWDEKRIDELVSLFDTAQRRSVAEFLRSIVDCDALLSWHSHADQGLQWWLK